MFQSENNIYRNGWLDLVFAGRNQQYGAYVLRLEYSSTLSKSLVISVLLFSGLISVPFLLQKFRPGTAKSPVISVLQPMEDKIFVSLPPKIQAPQTPAPPAVRKLSAPAATIRYTVPVPAEVRTEVTIPSVNDLQLAEPGPAAITGKPGVSTPVSTGTGDGNGTVADDRGGDNAILNFADKSPEFPGGQEAFAKFIRKNLRYPERAADAGATGKVVINFVVEKDGSVSGIKLVRGIGFGCDEEAIRVLRKVPAWIPGEQNGKRVRVQFTVPLVFEMLN